MGVRLIIEDLEGTTTVVPLASEEVTIGRKDQNTIQLTEQNVSRRHAKLNYRDDGWLIEDLHSYNGVKVNGIPIAGPTVLREGDLIQIADYHLTLTDDVDRQTVDIERPRAANDDVLGLAGSSVALPSVSARELSGQGFDPRRVDDEQDEERKGGGAVWFGIIAVLLIAVALGAYLMMQNDEEPTGVAAEVPAPQAKPEVVPPPEPEPEPVPVPVPPPEVAAETGAVEDPPAGEDESEAADTAAVEPPPEAVETKPTKKTTTSTKTKVDPVAALADARKQLMSGNSAGAYKLAKSAYDAGKDSEALDVMGVAACKMGSESKAKAAFAKMSASQKDKLQKVCASAGITL